MGDNCVGIHPSLVNAAGGDTSVRSSQPRARSRFKAEIAKLPLRFAHAVGLKCATVAPEEDPQSRYLSTLSHDKMNSTDVLMELMYFIGNYQNTAPDSDEMKKLSDFQLYNIYRNFKEHGELVTALQEFIRDKAWGGDGEPRGDQQELVKYVRSMCHTLEETRNEVEKLLTERKIAIDFKVGATSDDSQRVSILKVLNEAWIAAKGDGGNHPIQYIAESLIEGMIDRACERGDESTVHLTKLNQELLGLGRVRPALLFPLLRNALRRVKIPEPRKKAAKIAVILTSKQDKQLLWELFYPLYYAMIRQNDGSRMAKHALLEAMENITGSGRGGETITIPKLANAQDQFSVMVAIHELASYACRRGNEHFDSAVERVLEDQKEFRGETAKTFLEIAEELLLFDDSARVREIIRKNYERRSRADTVESRKAEAAVEDSVPRLDAALANFDRRNPRLVKEVLRDTWEKVKHGGRSRPATNLEGEVSRTSREREFSKSPKAIGDTKLSLTPLRVALENLLNVREAFEREGVLKLDTLAAALEQALRIAGVRGRTQRRELAQTVIERLASQQRTSSQRELLIPLLDAMYHQLERREDANQEFTAALRGFEPRKIWKESYAQVKDVETRAQPVDIQELLQIQDEVDLADGFHDIARQVLRQFLLDPPNEATFKAAVKQHLLEEKVTVLLRKGFTEDQAAGILELADKIKLEGRSRLVRDALRELIEEQEGWTDDEQIVETAVQPLRTDMTEIDHDVYDEYLEPFFAEICTRFKSGSYDDVDDIVTEIGPEIGEKLKSSSFEEVLNVSGFCARQSWIINYFSESSGDLEQALALLVDSIRASANRILEREYGYKPQFRSNPRNDRFEEISRSSSDLFAAFDAYLVERRFDIYEAQTSGLVATLAAMPPVSAMATEGGIRDRNGRLPGTLTRSGVKK
jgi:hypothetical protein